MAAEVVIRANRRVLERLNEALSRARRCEREVLVRSQAWPLVRAVERHAIDDGGIVLDTVEGRVGEGCLGVDEWDAIADDFDGCGTGCQGDDGSCGTHYDMCSVVATGE